MFEPGSVVLHRMPFVDDAGRTPTEVTDVKPMVVVQDTPELVSLWLPAGTPTLRPVPLDPAQPKPWLDGQWKLIESAWDRWNAVFLMVPGEWHATWVMWSPGWDFLGWYINLQEPIVRTPVGFDTRDLQLDVLVAPDRTWRWKDEADLERSVETGLFSPATAARTREAGLAAIARVESGAWPFTIEWLDWRPNPSWPSPTLPPGDLLALDPSPRR